MRKAPEYKGVLLMPGSVAFELYQEGDFKKLDKHMKELEQKDKDLKERYEV